MKEQKIKVTLRNLLNIYLINLINLKQKIMYFICKYVL